MKHHRPWLALPLILFAATAPAVASDLKDKAGLFSPDAVRKAQSELDRIEVEFNVPVTLETVTTLDGEPIREVATRHAKAAEAHGLYFVIAKKEHNIFGEPSRGYQKYFSRDRIAAIDKSFTADFREGNYDAGLDKGLAKIRGVFEEAKVEAGGPLKPSEQPGTRKTAQPTRVGRAGEVKGKSSWGGLSLFSIILGILALFLVIRVVGALFGGNRGGYSNANRMGGGPGYGPGGPGYGGAPAGGGGFMNSMFGGIGGALAGNWLYDQFSGGRHNSGYADQTAYDPNAAASAEPAAPEWGEGGAGADWGGGAADAGGGGDWGGGAADAGGGDWGGGGGGGDDGASW